MKPNVTVSLTRGATAVQTASGFSTVPGGETVASRAFLAPLGLRERASARGSEWDAMHRLILQNPLDLKPSEAVSVAFHGRHARTVTAKIVEVERALHTFIVLIND